MSGRLLAFALALACISAAVGAAAAYVLRTNDDAPPTVVAVSNVPTAASADEVSESQTTDEGAAQAVSEPAATDAEPEQQSSESDPVDPIDPEPAEPVEPEDQEQEEQEVQAQAQAQGSSERSAGSEDQSGIVLTPGEIAQGVGVRAVRRERRRIRGGCDRERSQLESERRGSWTVVGNPRGRAQRRRRYDSCDDRSVWRRRSLVGVEGSVAGCVRNM